MRTEELEEAAFEKYKYYEASVQCVDAEIEFIDKEYKRINGKKPLVLREDFCGTGMLMCDWVRQSSKHFAFGTDLSSEPIVYGKGKHWGKLKPEQKKRVEYYQQDVRDKAPYKADVIAAFNFSYNVFHARKDLVAYFKTVRAGLKPGGLFFIDLFGGPESQTICTEKRKVKDFTYVWECKDFNPITAECQFAIHFRFNKKKKKNMKNAFVYDWRLWTFAELRDIMLEAGFTDSVAYWEEDDGDGGGSGEFTPTQRAENCESWVAYLVGTTS